MGKGYTGKSNTLLGRTGINTLLLARPTSGEQSRKLALRVKAAIGSLGGFIDDPSSVYIKTLTLAPNTLSAIEVMERLERPIKAPGQPNANHRSISFNTLKPRRVISLYAYPREGA